MRRVWMVAVLVAAGCGRGGPDVAPEPMTELARARTMIRHGNYGRAIAVFQRLSFELAPSQPEAAEVVVEALAEKLGHLSTSPRARRRRRAAFARR